MGKGANLSDAPRKVGRHRIWLNNSGMAAENLCERSRNKQQPESLLREVQIELLTKHKFGKLLPKDLGSHAQHTTLIECGHAGPFENRHFRRAAVGKSVGMS